MADLSLLLPKLAYRNVLRQRRRSLLTGLSMTGGYILLCFSISLVRGSYGHMIDIFTRDHTGHVQIHFEDYLKRPRIHKLIMDTREVERVLRATPHVVSFAPRIYAPALSYGHDKSTPVRVVGIDPRLERNTSMLYGKVKEGAYFADRPNADGYYPAMIGQGVANALGIGVGDQIVLISEGADGSIANDIFEVAATVGTKSSYEKQLVFLPMSAAREFLTIPEGVHEYSVLLERSDQAIPVAQSLRGDLANPDWSVAPWQEVEDTFYKSMRSDIRGNYVSLAIITFIVCIGVLNTVLMSVLERTREFGVLRAVGTDPFTIMGMILTETSVLALMSCVLGLALSVPLIAWFTYEGIVLAQVFDIGGIEYNRILGEFSFGVFAWPALTIIATAAAISVPPAIRAARIVPVEALRRN